MFNHSRKELRKLDKMHISQKVWSINCTDQYQIGEIENVSTPLVNMLTNWGTLGCQPCYCSLVTGVGEKFTLTDLKRSSVKSHCTDALEVIGHTVKYNALIGHTVKYNALSPPSETSLSMLNWQTCTCIFILEVNIRYEMGTILN